MPLQQLANTDIQTGIITGDRLASNTITSTQFQTNSIESYLNTQGTNLGMRNRIINGAMMIDQRNAGANTVPSSDGLCQMDRWQSTFTAGSKFSVQQNAGSVTPPVGYTNYLGITSTSAFSVTSTDKLGIQQNIEGFNTADLMWGTAYAKTVTLSAWVYSSLTGTFGGSIRNNDSSRSYPFTFNIPSANTWTYINITIPGDTTGTWIGATNACGMRVMFSLGAGSSASGTAGTWAGSNYWSATGATSVVGTSGATFYITGVQLEKGSQATPFEYRQYGTELALCQRYFNKLGVGVTPGTTGIIGSYSASPGGASGSWWFPVSMRSAPTVTFYSGSNVTSNFSTNEMTNTWSGTINSYAVIATGSTASSEL